MPPSKVVGVWRVALRIAVAAPPEAGKANAAVIKLPADALGVRRSEVRIVSDQRRRLKRVCVNGLTAARGRAAVARVPGAIARA